MLRAVRRGTYTEWSLHMWDIKRHSERIAYAQGNWSWELIYRTECEGLEVVLGKGERSGTKVQEGSGVLVECYVGIFYP